MNIFSKFRAANFEKYGWLCDDGFANWVVGKIAPYGNSVLDIGCGNGFMLPYYNKIFSRVAAIEPCEVLYQHILNNVDYDKAVIKKATAESIPFSDLSYDVVLAKSSLHHFANVNDGLKEMMRVAQNAIAVIEVIAPSEKCLPFLKEILLKKERTREETSIYTEASIKDVLQNQFGSKPLYQLHYDQYIDVEDWLKYSDLNEVYQKDIINQIKGCNSEMKEFLHIHLRVGRLVMLRRMCLNIALLNC